MILKTKVIDKWNAMLTLLSYEINTKFIFLSLTLIQKNVENFWQKILENSFKKLVEQFSKLFIQKNIGWVIMTYFPNESKISILENFTFEICL